MASDVDVGLIDDVLGVIRRRRRTIAIVAGLLAAVATVVIAALPDVYESHCVVVVEPARIRTSTERPAARVPPLTELIGGLRRSVLSRETLRKVIDELDLYGERAASGETGAEGREKGWFARLFATDVIERARKDIRIDIVRPDEQEYVEITARARTGDLAARAVERIAGLLAARNRELRLESAKELGAFIDGEQKKAAERLRAEEESLARFRQENRDLLPENAPLLAARAERLSLEHEARVRRLEELSAELDALQRFDLAALGRGRDPGAVLAAVPPEALRLSALEKQLLDARRTDEDLETRGYRPTYPDRRQAIARIAKLEQKIAAARAEVETAVAAAGALPASATFAATTLPAGLPVEPAGSPSVASLSLASILETPALRLAARRREKARLEREEEHAAKERASIAALRSRLEAVRVVADRGAAAHAQALEEHRRLVEDRRVIARFIDVENASYGDQLRTLERAVAPTVPAAPRRALLFVLAVVGSIGVGGAVAYLAEVAAATYRSQEEVEADLGHRVLALVPSVRPPPDGAPLAMNELEEAADGQMSRIRHAILHAARQGGPPLRSILVTSAAAGEGKTSVAIGLARSFARSLDHSALLVEGDLRRPEAARALGVAPAAGLAEHIALGAPLRPRPTSLAKLEVVTAGKRVVDPAHVIASASMRDLAARLRDEDPARVVIFDAPPLLGAPEALSLSVLVDAIVLVVRCDATPRAAVRRALATIPAEKVIGVVLNGAWLGAGERRLYGPSDRPNPAEEDFVVIEEPRMLAR